MSGIATFFIHPVTVRTLTGSGAYGDEWAADATVRCWVEDNVHEVRNTSNEQVVSSGIVYGPLAEAERFTPGSVVVLPSGRESQVITVSRWDSGALRLPDHVEVHLT